MSWLTKALNGLMSLLGLAFVFAGGVKLRAPGQAHELFVSWGLDPVWAVPLAGWVEVGLGALLFHPLTRRAGAAAMVVWMAGFSVIQGLAGQPAAAAASLTVLLVSGVSLLRPRPPSGAPLVPAPLVGPPAALPPGAFRLLHLVGLAFLFRWAIGGTLFWSALPFLAWSNVRTGRRPIRTLPETTLLYLLVLGLGTSGLWSFIGHTFMAQDVSAAVGWAPSPFQSELAFYHLGVGIAGLACWWVRDRFWVATALIPSIFLYGAGWVHVQNYLESGNTAPANWGFSILFGNLLLPTVLLGLTVHWLRMRPHREIV